MSQIRTPKVIIEDPPNSVFKARTVDKLDFASLKDKWRSSSMEDSIHQTDGSKGFWGDLFDLSQLVAGQTQPGSSIQAHRCTEGPLVAEK